MSMAGTVITELTLPSTLTNIGMYAFYGCCNFNTIKTNAKTPPTVQDKDNELFISAIYENCVCTFQTATSRPTLLQRMEELQEHLIRRHTRHRKHRHRQCGQRFFRQSFRHERPQTLLRPAFRHKCQRTRHICHTKGNSTFKIRL